MGFSFFPWAYTYTYIRASLYSRVAPLFLISGRDYSMLGISNCVGIIRLFMGVYNMCGNIYWCRVSSFQSGHVSYVLGVL